MIEARARRRDGPAARRRACSTPARRCWSPARGRRLQEGVARGGGEPARAVAPRDVARRACGSVCGAMTRRLARRPSWRRRAGRRTLRERSAADGDRRARPACGGPAARPFAPRFAGAGRARHRRVQAAVAVARRAARAATTRSPSRRSYARAGAAAISVLTEPTFFDGVARPPARRARRASTCRSCARTSSSPSFRSSKRAPPAPTPCC